MAALSAASLLVCVPAFAPPGWSVRWRVAVGDHWESPGTPFAVEPGVTEVAIQVEATAPETWIQATARLRVDVMPAGMTRVVIPTREIRHAFALQLPA